MIKCIFKMNNNEHKKINSFNKIKNTIYFAIIIMIY